MITEPTAAPAGPPPCDTRLATRISATTDRRLRLAALLCRQPLYQFLDQTLDRVLPPVGELAEQIQGGAPDVR